MHDSVQRVFRRLLGHRRLAEGQYVKLAAEYSRVKAHRVSAVAVEGQVGNGLWHGCFLCGVECKPRYFGDCILTRTNDRCSIRLARRKVVCTAGSLRRRQFGQPQPQQGAIGGRAACPDWLANSSPTWAPLLRL